MSKHKLKTGKMGDVVSKVQAKIDAAKKKFSEEMSAANSESRFSEQCWLIDHMHNISPDKIGNRGGGARGAITRISVGSDGGQFPFYKIKGSPAKAINILTTKTGEGGFFSLSPEKIGSLIPAIQFSVSNSRTTKINKEKNPKMKNPDKMMPLVFSAKKSHMGLHESTVAEITQGSRARGDGVGIKSFNWKYIGTNSYSASKLIDAELVLFFQEMQDLEHRQPSGARWLDLIIPKGVPSESANLFVKVGWSTPTGEQILNTKEAYAIEQAHALFHLTYKKHTFKFDEDGSIELSIQYVARHEEILGNRKYDLFAPSMTNVSANMRTRGRKMKENVEELKLAKSAMDKHQKNLTGKHLKTSKRQLRSIEASIRALNTESQAALDISRIERYRKIATWLVDKKRITTAAVSGKALDFYKAARNTHNAKDFAKAMVAGGHIPASSEHQWANNIDASLTVGNETGAYKVEGGTGGHQSKKTTWDTIRTKRHRVGSHSHVSAWDQTGNTRLDFSGASSKVYNAQGKAIKKIKDTAKGGEAIKGGLSEYVKEINILSDELLANPAEHKSGDPDQKWVRWFYVGDLLEFIFTGQGSEGAGITHYPDSADYVRPLIGDLVFTSTGVIGMGSEERINIADIPLSWPYFTEWFRNEVVRSKRESYPLDVFLADIVNLVVNALGPDCYGVMRDNLQSEKNISILPLFGHGSGFGATRDKVTEAAGKSNECTIAQLRGVGNAKGKGAKLGSDSIKHYLLLYSELEMINASSGLQSVKEDGTHTIFIGKDLGIVKKIELSQVDIKSYMEYMLMRNKRMTSGDDDSGLAAYKTPYKAKISMVGNGIYIPGRKLYISPASFSAKDLRIKRILGLGGYFDVTQVESKFSSGMFETIVTCLQTSFPPVMGKDGKYYKEGMSGNTEPIKSSMSTFRAINKPTHLRIRANDLKEKSEAFGSKTAKLK